MLETEKLMFVAAGMSFFFCALMFGLRLLPGAGSLTGSLAYGFEQVRPGSAA